MGRGRAKAKQTKVARSLKYTVPRTDLSALEQELHGSGELVASRTDDESDDTDLDDHGTWASSGR